MPPSSLANQKDLLEAIRLIHDHTCDPFPARLKVAIEMLFPDSYYRFEVFGKPKSRSASNTFTADPKTEITIHLRETITTVSSAPNKGKEKTIQLSHSIAELNPLSPETYSDALYPPDNTRQIDFTFYSDVFQGALIFHQKGKTYRDQQLIQATLLASHVSTAYETDLFIKRLPFAEENEKPVSLTTLQSFGLSRRESEVMHWILEGKRDSEIGVILSISVRTVNLHVGAILRKLEVETRTAAVNFILLKIGLEKIKRIQTQVF